MTTTSEKILSEMERMGKMKIKDLCAKIGWQYQKFRRRIKANDFSPGDPPLPDVLEINGVKYRKVRE